MFVVTADHGMEHGYTDPKKLGGWFDALRTSGVKTVESTRFVYVKNVRFDIHGEQPRAGATSSVAVRVINDDVNDRGFRPAVAGAKVVLTDDDGNRYEGFTDAGGVAHVQVSPAHAGELRVKITHPAFTTERTAIPVAGADGVLPKRRRPARRAHH
jgi:hypothetical protein